MKITHCFKASSFILAAALFAGPGFITHAAAQDRAYFIDLNTRTATELGNLEGGQTRPAALNDAGQVVGESYSIGGSHAFITGPDGVGMKDLGTLGGMYTVAYDINDSGQVVVTTYDYSFHSFITGPNGMGMRDLGTLGGRNSEASGINNSGQVVGSSDTSGGASHAFMTDVDGMSMRDLTASKLISKAGDINDKGQVVGWFTEERIEPCCGSWSWHAFITGPNGAGMKDIAVGPDGGGGGWYFVSPSSINASGQVTGSAGDPSHQPFITGEDGVGIRDVGLSDSNAISSGATGINDTGQVTLTYWMPEEDFPDLHRSFITGPDGAGTRELGTLGGDYSGAYAINNAGQVVGQSNLEAGSLAFHAFITGPNGAGITDLNSLVDLPEGIILTGAVDINNAGQVIAIGVIPEPETSALFLAGLAMIGFIARRKKMSARNTFSLG
ncbi:PEP-CTERM protein-sorting domain-containing protein [Nitrosospira sp. Nsp14]|uniref:HAF repeat-containing PEP-CTERM protein n=1 Tax=Nitrosospira sp. Nsp14 TaxID=1855333 RepID=UPI0008E4304C|nr:HAF repeat-containing PEP-CTERM protein [Nitrosospira sp. Nsp14]SFH42794.1 PEP-CTERM protein-sorting domain-containing protein [Nitrosospira sp. Nsp14]